MPSIRFRLDHPSLDGVAEKARERYGADARVLSAEEVRVGGIGGFFARRFIDVVVEVPDGPGGPWAASRPGATGLQELLEAAEASETLFRHPGIPPVSTESGAFIDVLDDLRRHASPAAPRDSERGRSRPVALLRAPGDLSLMVGIGEDPLVVARSLSNHGRTAELCTAGSLSESGYERVTDRRTAFAARARGVESHRPVIVAFGLTPGDGMLSAAASTILAIAPAQTWVAVDASRKADDTERWVKALATAVPVQAMAVLRSGWTTTPESVNSLGLPPGWTDAVG